MENKFSTQDFIQDAGIAGLIVAAPAVAYIGASYLINSHPSVPLTILSYILWIAKFAGCIYLMKLMMKKFAVKFDAERRSVRNFGYTIAALSSLVCSAAQLAFTIASSDIVQEATDTVMSQYSAMLDSNSMAIMENMLNNLPTITFCWSLFYCFIFGVIVTLCVLNSIVPSDPFANTKQ